MMKCLVCGNEITEEVCGHCGYDIGKETEHQCLQPGTELMNGKYRIGNVVGVGGFGITYAAWDIFLQKKVAVKEYMPGEFSTRMYGMRKVTVYGGEKEEQYRDGFNKFFDESQRLAKFTEVPGIVQIYDCFKENDTAYIVMEYLEGETLGERIKRDGKIPVQEAIEIIIPILDALEAVHAEGIIHRDIAPNNIFLTSDGGVKLLDFGAARSATGTHSKSLTVLYKEGFTAEEQYQSRGDQGSWTDVYATAATLYKAITGITPEGAMERRVKDTLKTPKKTGIKVPANIDTAIMNAMNVAIKKRTKTAGKFKEELLSDRTVRKHYGRTSEKRIGRIPIFVWVLSGLGIVVAGTILLMLQFGIIEFRGDAFANLFVAEGKVRMMNVVNMDLTEATERLENIGLGIEVVDYRYSNEIQVGRIISQDLEKGTVTDKGSVIGVVVSEEAKQVTVPDLEEMEEQEATQALEELCLEYNVIKQYGSMYPGRVMSTSPKSENQILQGETVTVYISEGFSDISDNEYTVESYVGEDYDSVCQLLNSNGIYCLHGEYVYDDDIEKGYIVNQDISEGTVIKGGDVVILNISLGVQPMEVPDVVGLTEEEAVANLEEAGLIANVLEEVNRDMTEGTVISQEIEAGELVDKGSEVEITVAIQGYDVPDLVGLTREEAQTICNQNGFNVYIVYDVGESNKVVSQSLSAGDIVKTPEKITLSIGSGEDYASSPFNGELMIAINEERASMGIGPLEYSTELSSTAAIIIQEGSAKGWYYNGNSTAWTCNPGYSSSSGVLNPYNSVSEDLLSSEYSYVGFGVVDGKVKVIIVSDMPDGWYR